MFVENKKCYLFINFFVRVFERLFSVGPDQLGDQVVVVKRHHFFFFLIHLKIERQKVVQICYLLLNAVALMTYVREVAHSYTAVAVGKLSSGSKWRSAVLPCSCELSLRLLPRFRK